MGTSGTPVQLWPAVIRKVRERECEVEKHSTQQLHGLSHTDPVQKPPTPSKTHIHILTHTRTHTSDPEGGAEQSNSLEKISV